MSIKQNIILYGICYLIISCSATGSASTNNKAVTDTEALLSYQDNIKTGFLKKHLSVLAADSMEGRETAMPGQKKAAKYLADQYKEMGLKAVGDSNSYYQKFTLNATINDSVVFQTTAVRGNKKTEIDHSVLGPSSVSNYIRTFGGGDSLQGRIIFAGFGINDPIHDVYHLSSVDLKGKWVMVFQEIPHVVEGDTLIDPSLDWKRRFQNILQKGAEGILMIPQMSAQEFRKEAQNKQTAFGKPTNMRLAYRDTSKNRPGGLNRGYNDINPKLAAQLLNIQNDSTGLDSYKQNLISNITDFRPRKLNFSLTQKPYSREVMLETENVLALFEGADSQLKDEAVVMTAHYDHVGIGRPDSTGDRIYNGADDDGSGTVGLLNIAKALTDAGKQGIRPKRSILFLHVSGEEKGLLGSRYYSDHPIYPIKKTITNINTDMIGRIDNVHKQNDVEDYTYIIGSDIISSELDSLIKVANARAGQVELSERYNDLEDPNQFYRRSDHWNFGRLEVPFVFFFTGVHEDYHRPSDEIQKIRFDKMVKIVRTIYASAVMVANAETTPKVDNQAFIQITKGK